MLSNKLTSKFWHKENAANHLINVKLDPKAYTIENIVCAVNEENYERMGANLELFYRMTWWHAGQTQVLSGASDSAEQRQKVIVMGLSLPWTLSPISGSNTMLNRALWFF